jgi:hypothetical protein
MAVTPGTPIAALVAWTRSHPAYTYSVDATELGTNGSMVHSAFEISYDGRIPEETVHVLAGNGAGSTVTWRSGDRVSVRPPGVLRMVSIGMNVRDGRILSPRGNDVRNAIFSRVVDCIAEHADQVKVERTAAVQTFTIRNPAGVHCGAEDGDKAVTVDRVTISAEDEHPMMRERFAGDTLVERWVMRDLKVTP